MSRLAGTYARIAELPLAIESYRLERLEAPVTRDLTRVTTLVRLVGGGEEGLGEAAAAASRALPAAALQARPRERVDGRARRRAGRDRNGRHRRLQGLLRGSGLSAAGRCALPPCRRGLPRGLARRSGADSRDGRGLAATPRPNHLGRADSFRCRRRGARLRASDAERQAFALRLSPRAARLLRLLRDSGDRSLRRRHVRARPRARPDPTPRLAVQPGRSERRGSRRLQRALAAPRRRDRESARGRTDESAHPGGVRWRGPVGLRPDADRRGARLGLLRDRDLDRGEHPRLAASAARGLRRAEAGLAAAAAG